MDGEEQTNLNALRSTQAPDFMDELEFSVDTLRPKQAAQYFSILLNHFQKEVQEDVGKAILIAVSKVICVDDFLSIFIANGHPLQLPFKNKLFSSEIFDILFVLVTVAPLAFDEQLSKCFGGIIRRDPSKSLTLLAIYSQHFNEIDNPWPMVDLLIQEAHRFTGQDTVANYASLLAFLCRKYPDYCEGRSEHCWRKTSALLASKDNYTLKAVYCAMFSITEVYKEAVSPVEAMKPHLKVTDLQDSVLTLLLAAPPIGKMTQDKELLKTLALMAETSKNATLVLMRIATDDIFSKFLVQHAELWMTRELPTVIDTMRLFFVVFGHIELRPLIAKSPKFIEFLKMVTEQGNGSTLSMICTVIRRVDITEDFINELSATGFLSAFFKAAISIKNSTAVHSAFLMLDTLAKVGYAHEFPRMCDFVADTVKERGELSEVASIVAIQLCSYESCRKAFKKKRLDEFMRNNTSNAKFKTNAIKFLSAIDDSEH